MQLLVVAESTALRRVDVVSVMKYLSVSFLSETQAHKHRWTETVNDSLCVCMCV